MLGIHNYWVFVTAGVLLNLTPGQDTMYILGRSIAEGRKAGVASALGIGTGTLFHIAAAMLGLSAVLTASAVAFTFLKLAGAAYLVYLGLRLLFERGAVHGLAQNPSAKPGVWIAYRRGILTNVLNPKVAIFFLAFLPQFVDPSSGHSSLSFLVLGATFVFTGTIWCLVIAVVSAKASDVVRRSFAAARLMHRIVGIVFIGLGIKLALERAK